MDAAGRVRQRLAAARWSCTVTFELHQLDALINGLAFVGLVIGLAVGWRRSSALRETIVELFFPSRTEHKIAESAIRADREITEESGDPIVITWHVYQAQQRQSPVKVSSAEDSKNLTRLHELVTV